MNHILLLTPCLLPLISASSLAETLNFSGTNGSAGAAGFRRGEDGSDGSPGQSFDERAENTDDADKTVILTGGNGGNGGAGRFAIVTLDAPTQKATLPPRGTRGGNGGSAGAGTPSIDGLGGNRTAGALDAITFTVRRDGVIVLLSNDSAILTDTVTVVDDLSLATLDTVFEWELQTSSSQTFDTYFAFSSSLSTGHSPPSSGDAVPQFTSFDVAPIAGTGTTHQRSQFSVEFPQGHPLGSAVLQTSRDLGQADPWRSLWACLLDENGALLVNETIDLGTGGGPKGFFRICRP